MIGRLAFIAGLRGALRANPRVIRFADRALAAKTVGVGIEIIEYGLTPGSA
jgi:hypothetical protein